MLPHRSTSAAPIAVSSVARWLDRWGWLAWIILIAGVSWAAWWPPLLGTNAGAALVADARARVDHQATQRSAAVQAAAVLDGPRGDFEQRGLALASQTNRQQAATDLADDARLMAQVAASAAAEREALRAYDAALMARTRDLGPTAESLRSATWPIVEHLKLYPPPLGLQTQWHPPDAAFFVQQAQIIETGTPAQQLEAAIAVGRSTYSVRQLRELDAIYRAELDSYAATLETQIVAQSQPPSTQRTLLAGLIFALLAGSFGAALWQLRASPHRLALTLAALAGALWYWPTWLPLVALGGLAVVAVVAWRPLVAAVLPLAAVPLYYRPRSLGSWSFPPNETLIGLIIAGLVLHGLWGYRRGKHSMLNRAVGRNLRWLALIGAALVLAAGLTLLSPALANQRVALRELRRTIVEPLVWALIVGWLMQRKHLRPTTLLWAIIVPAAWVAIDGITSFGLGRNVWATAGVPRLIGLLPSSTALGVYLAAATAAALAWALVADDPQTTRAAWLLSVPLVLATMLTFTRGAWLGVAAGIGVVLLARRRWRMLLAAGGVGVASAGISLVAAPALLARVLRVGEGTGAARGEIWAAALRAIRASPLLGLGMDQFAHVEPSRYAIPQIRFLTIAHPHNLVFDVWLQLGILGLLIVGGVLVWTVMRLWRQRQQPLAVVALALLTDLIVHGLLDQTLLGGDMIYIWLSAVLIAAWLPAVERRTS